MLYIGRRLKMVKPEVIREQPINVFELKHEIEAIKKREKELRFRSQKTEEYLNQFVKLSMKEAEEFKKKLDGIKITRLKEEYTVKIIDTMPLTVDELKTLLQGNVVTINKDDMTKIVEFVISFAK